MKFKLTYLLVLIGLLGESQTEIKFSKKYDFFDTNPSTSGYLSLNTFSINNDYLLCGLVITPTINQGLGIIRTDSIGTIKYQKQIKSPNNLSFTNNTASQAYIKLKNNNLLFTGQYDVSLNHTRACLTKVNHNTGDTLWTKEYKQPGDTTYLLCSTELQDSSTISFGYKYNTCTTCNNNSKPFMMKVDKNGNYKWHKYINANFSTTDYYYQKIIKLNDNDFIVVGYKYSNICQPQAFCMRIDTNAVQQYNVNFSGIPRTGVADCIALNDGSFLAAGSYISLSNCSVNPDKYRKYVYKFNPNTGAKISSKTYNVESKAGNGILSLVQKPDGTILAGGGTGLNFPINTYNNMGDVLWLNTNLDSLKSITIDVPNPSDQAPPNQLLLTSDGGFVAAIASYPNTGQAKFWLVKADSNGCYTSACAAVGINELNPDSYRDKDEELNIYPNPANSVINVEFLVFNNKLYNIAILNTLGQTVYQSTINSQQSSINIKELPTGLYQLKISEGNRQRSFKFIKN